MSTAFFASPASHQLKKLVKERTTKNGAPLKKIYSQESNADGEPLHGLPSNPGADLNEIKKELEALHKRKKSLEKKEL